MAKVTSYLLLFLCGAGDGSQVRVHARQVLSPELHPSFVTALQGVRLLVS
jgi:hypothetical protein